MATIWAFGHLGIPSTSCPNIHMIMLGTILSMHDTAKSNNLIVCPAQEKGRREDCKWLLCLVSLRMRLPLQLCQGSKHTIAGP